MAKSDPEREYEENVGHPPRDLPESHPYRWQWEYRGTKADREHLRELLEIEDGDTPVVIDGQEELF